jgi:hypothetical protein
MNLAGEPAMPKDWSFIAISVLVCALMLGFSAPMRADSLDCKGQLACTDELVAQSTQRPQITVRPRRRHPGPNAKRYCRAWLAQEYRVSGSVIVPRMQCWWQ